MGHRKQSSPRRGSLAFLPRGRTSALLPRIKHWPSYDGEPRLMGFIGYKAGLTHAHVIDTVENSPSQGTEIMVSATLVAVPPVLLAGLRLYEKDFNGNLRSLTTLWGEKVPDDIKRLVPTFKSNHENVERAKGLAGKASEVRALLFSQAKNAGLEAKKPLLLEVKVGGKSPAACFDHALGLLSKTVSFKDLFKPGEFVDISSVTKGKGFQGVVKRHHVKTLPRKSRKTKRGVASIGAWHPAYVPYTTPRSGQMGFHRRTEYNKKILRIVANGSEVMPKSGIHRFGVVETELAVLQGTVPGTPKRPLVIRMAVRAHRSVEEPQVTHLAA